MRISLESSGSYDRLEAHLRRLQRLDLRRILEPYGREGVEALRRATPRDSGLAAESWDYELKITRTDCSIIWTNSDTEGEFPVAIMLQYGYGTGTGGYVQGRDYINPALQPIFDRISDEVWKAVTSK